MPASRLLLPRQRAGAQRLLCVGILRTLLLHRSNVRVQEQSGVMCSCGVPQFDPAACPRRMIAARVRSTVELDGESQILEKAFTTAGSAQSCYSPLD